MNSTAPPPCDWLPAPTSPNRFPVITVGCEVFCSDCRKSSAAPPPLVFLFAMNVSSLTVIASASVSIATALAFVVPVNMRCANVNESRPLAGFFPTMIGCVVTAGSSVVPGAVPSIVNASGLLISRLTLQVPAATCRTSPALAAVIALWSAACSHATGFACATGAAASASAQHMVTLTPNLPPRTPMPARTGRTIYDAIARCSRAPWDHNSWRRSARRAVAGYARKKEQRPPRPASDDTELAPRSATSAPAWHSEPWSDHAPARRFCQGDVRCSGL